MDYDIRFLVYRLGISEDISLKNRPLWGGFRYVILFREFFKLNFYQFLLKYLINSLFEILKVQIGIYVLRKRIKRENCKTLKKS